jgi:hypothetical protein
MIRKSGHRFSEKDHAQTKIERDDDSKKGHLALGKAGRTPQALPEIRPYNERLAAAKLRNSLARRH